MNYGEVEEDAKRCSSQAEDDDASAFYFNFATKKKLKKKYPENPKSVLFLPPFIGIPLHSFFNHSSSFITYNGVTAFQY